MDSPAILPRQICRVLIVDDHPMVRDGVKSMLESKRDQYYFHVDQAEDATEAMKKLYAHTFDIVLLDYRLPGTPGPGLAEQILRMYPELKILGMSSHAELMNIKKMLYAGASGYISKNVEAAELVNAIHSVLNGRSYFSAEVANKLLEDNKRNPLQHNDIPHKVSPRELEVLKLIAQEKTNKEIADELYLAERTIETHRKNLLQKFGVRNTAGLIRAAYELKLLP